MTSGVQPQDRCCSLTSWCTTQMQSSRAIFPSNFPAYPSSQSGRAHPARRPWFRRQLRGDAEDLLHPPCLRDVGTGRNHLCQLSGPCGHRPRAARHDTHVPRRERDLGVPAIADKLGGQFGAMAQSPFVEVGWPQWVGIPFESAIAQLSNLSPPALLHLVAFEPGGFNTIVPDQLAARSAMGSNDDFAAWVQAQARAASP